MPKSSADLQQKAKDFAYILPEDDSKASKATWSHAFESWHNVVHRVIDSEFAFAESDTSALWMAKKLPDILGRNEAADLYNTMALFYQIFQSHTLGLEGDGCSANKANSVDSSDRKIP